jgi:hypothetical protein
MYGDDKKAAIFPFDMLDKDRLKYDLMRWEVKSDWKANYDRFKHAYDSHVCGESPSVMHMIAFCSMSDEIKGKTLKTSWKLSSMTLKEWSFLERSLYGNFFNPFGSRYSCNKRLHIVEFAYLYFDDDAVLKEWMIEFGV